MDARYLFYCALLFTAAFLGCWKWKTSAPPYRWLSAYIALVFVSEIITRVVGYFYHNSMAVYHVLVPIQILIYSRIYLYFFTSKSARQLIIFSGACVAVLAIINSTCIQPVTSLNSNGILLLTCFVIPLVLFSFRQMLLKPAETFLLRTPLFWLNTGSLIFYPITFLFFGYYNFYLQTPEWGVQLIWIGNVLMYTSYMLALVFAAKEHNPRS